MNVLFVWKVQKKHNNPGKGEMLERTQSGQAKKTEQPKKHSKKTNMELFFGRAT